MSLAGVNLRDLEYVVAIADEGSFVAAARKCHVSQPSLSSQVRKVELWAGTQIFERTSRRLLVTSAGERFLAQARAVLREAQLLQALNPGNGAPFGGTLHLSAIATLGPYLFPRILVAIKRAYAGLSVILGEGVTGQLLLDLRAGDLDAVLVSPPIEDGSLTVEPLFREPFYVATSEPDRRAAEELWAGLEPGRRLLLEDGHCLRDQALAMCADIGRRDRHGTSIETLKYMVAAGEGLTLVPALAANPIEGLIYKEPASADFSRQIALVWRRSDAREREFRALAALFREIASGLPKLLPVPVG